RIAGVPLERDKRVTYVDWLDPLMRTCRDHGFRVFSLGGKPGVGERAAAVLRDRHTGLDISARHGYFDVTPGSAENEDVLSAIEEYRSDVLIVGMGMPRQEHWIMGNLNRVEAKVILPAGACMDYVAGVVPTPPRWAGQLGVEWLFRLVAEPGRLGRRYLFEPWALLPLLGKDVIRNRIQRSS
ncbi:MAG: WecB/TagA/CpsF family glycosyltransferase, partial [Rhodothermia bacterium]|nr:WecB/TagA/CpsF family glycosyltransferase [Rhodothermia bacterium]